MKRSPTLAAVTLSSVFSLLAAGNALAQPRPWMDTSLKPAERAKLVIAAMTIDEKIEQIALNTGPNPGLPGCGLRNDTRHMEGIPRLGVPTLRFTNGPIGVAGGDCNPNPPTTALPTALLVAATWNVKSAQQWGEVAGVETRNIAHHNFSAPGMNLTRVGRSGRNFEYFGEDPFLTGTLAVQQVKAIQSQGTQVAIKHFVANEQETGRMSMDTLVDDRTLHELYMLPFEMSVRDAKPASIMCSYPKIGGVFACESPRLLQDVLRKQWGFQGYVVSDRKATHSTAAAIKAGLDMEFDSKAVWFTPEKVKAALAAGEVTVSDLDTMLEHRLSQVFALGQFDHPIDSFTPVDFPAHAEISRKIAEEGGVLLKNEGGLLPLKASVRSIALIGAASFAGQAKLPSTGPRGIITVNSPLVVTPIEGLNQVLKKIGSSAKVTYDDGKDLVRAKALAASSDVAIVMAGDISLEGEDRTDLSLPSIDGVNQNALIAAITSVNKRTVVVLKDGGPVLMPWLNAANAVLEVWYPGQADGTAVGNLLFGVANPSGKLPITFPKTEVEGAVTTAEQFPGVMVGGVRTVKYSEGLEMGYRWYDAHKMKPQFPFGFGLSYTTFAISQLRVTGKTDGVQPVQVRFVVQNTGKVAGAEVPQVYLGLPTSTGEPPKRLVAFQKIFLAPGEKKTVQMTIDPGASNHPMGYWDTAAAKWVIADGEYRVMVGNSSDSAQLEAKTKVRR